LTGSRSAATAAAEGRRRSLVGRSLGLTVALALSQVMTALIYIVAARNTTLVDFGRAAAVVGIALSVAAFLDFGSTTHWVRMISGGRTDESAYVDQTAAKLRVAAVAGTGLATVVWSMGDLTDLAIVGVGLLLAGTVAVQTFSVPLRVREQFGRVGAAAVFGRAAGLAVAAVGVLVASSATYVLTLALGVGVIVECTMLLVRWPAELRNASLLRVFRGRFTNPWRGASVIGFSSALVGLQNSDVAVAERVADASVAGEYAAVTRWTGAIGLLSSAASQVAMPRLARAGNSREALRELARLSWLLLPAIVGVVAIVALAPQLVSLLLGSQYEDSADVLRWLAIATLPALLTQPMLALLQARHFERSGLLAVGIAVPLQLVLVAVLAPKYGAVGVAQASLLSQCLILLILGLATRRMLKS
jgi:O-antigen/teichoic acid export membrane protein